MTTNQISYLRNQEEARHNRVQEQAALETSNAQLQQAAAARANVDSAYITALSNQKQAEAAMNQANARWGELQYKYDTIPLYERDVGAKEKTADASATSADAQMLNAKTNAEKIPIEQQNADSNSYKASTDRLRAIIEQSRVQAYIKSVAQEATRNSIDAKRAQQDMEQFMLNYGLAKSELERKQAVDDFTRKMKVFEATWKVGGAIGQKIKGISKSLKESTSTLISFIPGAAAWTGIGG